MGQTDGRIALIQCPACLSVPRCSCLGYRHAGCLQLSHSLFFWGGRGASCGITILATKSNGVSLHFCRFRHCRRSSRVLSRNRSTFGKRRATQHATCFIVLLLQVVKASGRRASAECIDMLTVVFALTDCIAGRRRRTAHDDGPPAARRLPGRQYLHRPTH